MTKIRREGEVIRTGFNFYPLSDKGSIGFIFRAFEKTITVRYSKITGKFGVLSLKK